MTTKHLDRLNNERNWPLLVGYSIVVFAIWIGWSLRDQEYIIPADGIGYWLGITGASAMLLLMLYPLRKRAKFLRSAGEIRYWFRTHMILGIVGPVFVLFHSNFNLGSINSRVALICTLVVASSGVIGRYLYAKIHNGMYGQRLTFESVRQKLEDNHTSSSSRAQIAPLINDRLVPIEDATLNTKDSIGASTVQAIAISFRLIGTRLVLRQRIRRHLAKLAIKSEVIAANRKRLRWSAYKYLDYRLSVLRKFAQLRAAERLFSLWHIVHYPLFMVLLVAAVVHVIAVHMY